MKLSIIVTAKDSKSKQLKRFLESVEKQDYLGEKEVIVVTEGNSESAKAIGLRRAKGEIVAIFASDNELVDPQFISKCMEPLEVEKYITGSYPIRYYHTKKDNLLNRYFALVGVNDPVPLYLWKNDRKSYGRNHLYGYDCSNIDKRKYMVAKFFVQDMPTLGDNGFFIRRDALLKADIDHYYHIDVCYDLIKLGCGSDYAVVDTSIWHHTGGNIVRFFLKRFKYADKFMDNRRWKMIERSDWLGMVWFIVSTITIAPCVILSFQGYKKVKDIAWFLHYPVCLGSLITYFLLFMKRRVNASFRVL